MNKFILILGSSGVIGNNLKLFLKKKNLNIIDYDIKISTKYDLRNEKNISHLKECINKSDYIFFLAFDVGGSKYLNNVNNIKYLNDNIKLMTNTFNNFNNKPFIFASSQMENMDNSYGCLKRLGELFTKNLNGINIRFWNVYDTEKYGEKSHVITDFIYNSKKYNCINMLTNGEEERQFLHATDCSEGLYTIMIHHNKLKNKTIHLTSFTWTKIKDIAKIIQKKTNCQIKNKNKKDITQTIKNEPDKLILNYWKPTITIEEGIFNLITKYQ